MTSFTDLFIKRPVLAIVVSFVILIAGVTSDENVERSANIRAATSRRSPSLRFYVGADAELVRGFITTPVERAIAAADGIDYIQSQSTQSLSTNHCAIIEAPTTTRNKALSDISARVGRDSEQSAAGITDPGSSPFQAADSQFASGVLEFHFGHPSA